MVPRIFRMVIGDVIVIIASVIIVDTIRNKILIRSKNH